VDNFYLGCIVALQGDLEAGLPRPWHHSAASFLLVRKLGRCRLHKQQIKDSYRGNGS